MKSLSLALIIAFFIGCYSCENEKSEDDLSFDKISGCVQKGPYLNGTTITLSELTDGLSPTGKNYTTQIVNNKGIYELSDVNLASPFVELIANGFYFNEVVNSNSSAQLTLFALSDVSNKSDLNVNILSSLEKGRVKYLISEGSSFPDAKTQALGEILSIFEINSTGSFEPEQLDITKAGNDNAILLAISVILQGYQSVSELSELLANISTDIREDGKLDIEPLGSSLLNNAKAIKLDEIRASLENRCETLGLDISVPEFEKYVNQFITNTDFKFTGFIEYPKNGLHGPNILDKDQFEYSRGDHSLNAILPIGSSLRVKIQGDNWFYPVSQDWSGWMKSMWDDDDNSRTFTSLKDGELDLLILLEPGTKNIYAYENGDEEPSWTKVISVVE